jgi:hypothetical protein
MWAVVKGKIGIIVSFNEIAAEFHEVNAAGETVKVDIVDVDAVAQASLHDIPQARRPTKEVAKKFGYA